MGEEANHKLSATESVQGEAAKAGNDDVMNALKSIADRIEAAEKKTDARFTEVGRDFGKLRERFKLGDIPLSTAANDETVKGASPPPVTREDVLAYYELGEIARSLPDTLRQKVQTMLSDGTPFAEVRERVNFALEFQGTAATVVPQSSNPASLLAPKGIAAIAAQKQPVHKPASKAEYLEIVKSDPTRLAALRKLPTSDFDPSKLPDK